MGHSDGVDYRKKCFEQKGDSCVICGDDDVVVHHVNGDRSDNSIENLIPVCKLHHGRIHSSNQEVLPQYTEMLPDSSLRQDRVYSHYEVLDVFVRVNRPFISTGDVLDKTAMARPTANDILSDLVDYGFLHVHRIGNVPVYWLTNSGIVFLHNPDEIYLNNYGSLSAEKYD